MRCKSEKVLCLFAVHLFVCFPTFFCDENSQHKTDNQVYAANLKTVRSNLTITKLSRLWERHFTATSLHVCILGGRNATAFLC